MTPGTVLRCPDCVGYWIEYHRLANKIVGRRLEDGATSETDAALDRLIALRRWLEPRLGN